MRRAFLLAVMLTVLLDVTLVNSETDNAETHLRTEITSIGGRLSNAAPKSNLVPDLGDCLCKEVIWGRYCFNRYCDFAPDQYTGCGTSRCPNPPNGCQPRNCFGCCTEFRF